MLISQHSSRKGSRKSYISNQLPDSSLKGSKDL
jgi:hypothetical protein